MSPCSVFQFLSFSPFYFRGRIIYVMLRADFHRSHTRREAFTILPPSFLLSFLSYNPAARPPVLERRYGGKVILNSDNLQPLFQICKKTARAAATFSEEEKDRDSKVNARARRRNTRGSSDRYSSYDGQQDRLLLPRWHWRARAVGC